MICPKCQARVPDNSRHCDQCGAALPAAPAQRVVTATDNSGAEINSHNTVTHTSSSSVSHTMHVEQRNSSVLILALVIVALAFVSLFAFVLAGRTGSQTSTAAANPQQLDNPLSAAVIATTTATTTATTAATITTPTVNVTAVGTAAHSPISRLPSATGTPAPPTSTATATSPVTSTPGETWTVTATAAPAGPAVEQATVTPAPTITPAPTVTPALPATPTSTAAAAIISPPGTDALEASVCVQAEGIGFAPESETNGARRQRAAQLAAEIDAKRRLAEWSDGADIDSITIVSDSAIMTDTIRQTIKAHVTGAEIVARTYDEATGMATGTLAICDVDGPP